MPKNVTEDELGEVIHSIYDALVSADESRHLDEYESRFPEGVDSLSTWRTGIAPDYSRFNSLARIAVKELKVQEQDQFLIGHLLHNYFFTRNHIRKLMSHFEGGLCSGDKTAAVLASLVREAQGREMPTYPIQPSPEAMPLWRNMVRAVLSLEEAHIDEYLAAREDLSDFYRGDSTP